MGESHESLIRAVRHCQESLDKYTENRNDGKLLHYLEKLYRLPIKVVHLEETKVGRTVNSLRKLGGDVGDSAKSLVAKWKEMVLGEQEEEENEDNDEDDDDDEEDGYQSGEEPSNDSEEKDNHEEKIRTCSSHRKSDICRTEDRDKVKKSNHSSSGNHKSDSAKNSKHHKHTKHKSSHKRKGNDSSSEDETPRKRSKNSEDEDRHKKQRTESDRHKSEKVRKTDSPSESSRDRERHKSGSSSSKDKHKSSRSKKHEEKKNSDKDRKKEKEKSDKKDKSSKTKNGTVSVTGIDSGSGASFAEALGMCEPSSSKNAPKKKKEEKTLEKKEKNALKVDEPVPKLLKEPNLDPIDLNISNLLPPITPHYRPLGNLIASETPHKRLLTESETLANIITSKKERTKVYSGNKIGGGKVPSLFELCIRILQDNIDALEYTGGVPYNVLKPILEKANPNQLYMMEHHNPYLIEDTDELWQFHCQKEFRNKKREELETWREMYLRCLDERDAKLKALTANIKQSQDKSLPVRMTKLAYVDAVAKPPRNIARKQAKNGTAFDIRKPAMTPQARLNSLATAGEAGKVAVPNPGSRAVDRSGSNHVTKPKKAPLMLKSISSFKNRFKR